MCPESTSFLISRLIVRTDVPVISANLVCEIEGSTFISEIIHCSNKLSRELLSSTSKEALFVEVSEGSSITALSNALKVKLISFPTIL